MAKLDTLIKSINKKFGAESIILGSDLAKRTTNRLSTNILPLDIDLNGGIPQNGRLIMITGKESSGKTSLILRIIAHLHQTTEDGVAIFIDAEKSLASDNIKFYEKMGIDLNRLLIDQPDSGEEAGNMLTELLKMTRENRYNVRLIVVDSIAALIPTSEIDADMDKQQIGKQATLVNKLMRKVTAGIRSGHDNCSIIFTNQLRAKIGVMWGDPYNTPGGMGKDFFNSATIRLSRKEWIKEKDDIVGGVFKYEITKSKVSVPKKSGQYNFYFGNNKNKIVGVDEEQLIRMYGVKYGIIKLKGKTYYYNKFKLIGKEKMESFLRKNPRIKKSISDKIMKVALM